MSAREEQATFFGKLAALAGAGVPLLQAFETAAGGLPEGPVREALSRILREGYRGSSLTDAFRKEAAVFSPEVLVLVETGEGMGDLDGKAEALGKGLAAGVLSAPEPRAGPEAGGVGDLIRALRAAGAAEAIVEPGAGRPRVRLRTDSGLQAWSPPAGFDPGRLAGAAAERDDVEVVAVATSRGPELVVRRLDPEEEPHWPAPDEVAAWLAADRGLVLLGALPGRAREELRDALLAAVDRERRKVGVVGGTTRVSGVTVYPADPGRAPEVGHLDVVALAEPTDRAGAEAAAGAALDAVAVVTVTAADAAEARARLLEAGLPEAALDAVLLGTVVRTPAGGVEITARS